MSEIQPLLTPSQASEILGVTVGTLAIWRCLHRYNLPYKKIGRLVKYEQKAIAAFIDRRDGPCDLSAWNVGAAESRGSNGGLRGCNKDKRDKDKKEKIKNLLEVSVCQ
jgi:hypothetical protein